MYKFLLYTISCLLLTASSPAQHKQLEKKLDELLAKQFSAATPGCQVLVASKGEVIYNKAFGSANLQLQVPMTTVHVFNIASITKQFTAVAILQLYEQGKLSLQDSIQRFIPDYPHKGYTITIENLLTHSSGIGDYMQMEFNSPNMERWDFKPAQLIDSFKQHPLQFTPGTRFSYSNSGYYLLGYIIQKITGKSYYDYVQENLLAPLKMEQTYFDRSNKIIPGRVSGYTKQGAEYRNEEFWSPTIMYATGGLISNSGYLLKWHKGLYTDKLLKKESLQKAWVPYQFKDGSSSSYGYGWYLKNYSGTRTIEHQGGLPGFVSNEIYFPAEDIFIVLISNTGATPIDALSASIASLVLNRPLQSSIAMEAAVLEKYAGTYQLAGSSRKLEIKLEKNELVATLAPGQSFPLLFQTANIFQLKGILDAQGEFVFENSKLVKIIIQQNGKFEWMKL